jgi:hypothetical protein
MHSFVPTNSYSEYLALVDLSLLLQETIVGRQVVALEIQDQTFSLTLVADFFLTATGRLSIRDTIFTSLVALYYSMMASSSRLVGRLLGRPASFISYSSRSSVNSRSLYRAAFSTSAARADSSATTEEIKAEVIPDPAVLKRRKDIKGTSVKRKTTRRSTKTLSTEVSSKFAKAESEIFTPDVTGPFPHLPKEEDWDGAFNAASFWSIRHRQFIANPESIEKVVQSMELERRSKEAGRKLTILECYPGPGTITRRLMQDENVEKVVVMEDHKGFAPYLQVSQRVQDLGFMRNADLRHFQALSTDPTLGDNAAKLHIITNDCFNWETYTEMIDSGALDHIPAVKEIKESKPVGPLQFGDDWKAASPILLLGQFPTTVQAEQLLAQFTAAISRRYWQFRYTRMPMFFVCSEHTAWVRNHSNRFERAN